MENLGRRPPPPPPPPPPTTASYISVLGNQDAGKYSHCNIFRCTLIAGWTSKATAHITAKAMAN